jgi:hypothetical protein
MEADGVGVGLWARPAERLNSSNAAVARIVIPAAGARS